MDGATLKKLIEQGTFPKVVAYNDPKNDWTYTPEGLLHRSELRGLEGKAVAFSDSHGLCFQVFHEGTGKSAWFEADEITLL